MPIVQVHLMEGRSSEVKMVLARELTSAVERVLGSRPDRIHVVLTEHAAGQWMVGGEPLTVSEEVRQ